MKCTECNGTMVEWGVVSEGDKEYPFGTHYMECKKCGHEVRLSKITENDIKRLNELDKKIEKSNSTYEPTIMNTKVN